MMHCRIEWYEWKCTCKETYEGCLERDVRGKMVTPCEKYRKASNHVYDGEIIEYMLEREPQDYGMPTINVTIRTDKRRKIDISVADDCGTDCVPWGTLIERFEVDGKAVEVDGVPVGRENRRSEYVGTWLEAPPVLRGAT